MAIQRWIDHGEPEPIPSITREEFGRHMQFMAATLPFQNATEASSKDRSAVYYSLLRGYTNAAIAYMVKRSCAELQWFPVPAQCLAILADFKSPTSSRQFARMNLQSFAQDEMEAFCEQLAAGPVNQSLIDQQPEQWRRIAENRGLLRWKDGTFIQRFKAIPPAETVHQDQARAA